MADHPNASERIDLRTSAEVKELIARAAATTGVSLSAFLLASAEERAQQVLAEAETLALSSRDWQAFFSALDHIDQARPKLEAVAGEYLAWRKRNAEQ